MDKTQKEKIREICTYHGEDGTSGYSLSEERFEKIFGLFDLAIKETEERIVREIEGFNIERYARNESNMPSVKNLKEDILALIRNK